MPENIKIKSDELTEAARGQAVVEARHNLDGECRVLSASATAVTTPSEIFAGEARYVGKVKFDCLISVDGKIECISDIAEYSDKITSSNIDGDSVVTLMPEIVNVEATVDGGALKAVAVVDVCALAIAGGEHDCIAEPDEGIYAEKTSIDYCTVSARQTETVYLTDSAAITDVAEILCAASHAVISSAEASDGAVKVSGVVHTKVIVRNTDDTVSECKIVTPFVKDISALGVRDGDTAFAFAAITDSSATQDDGENNIELAVTMAISVVAMECRTAEIVADVFCADYEIEAATADIKCRTVEPMITVTDTVDGQIPIADDRLAADNVLCVSGAFCTLSDAKIEDKRICVEGLVGGDIVYYNAEKNATDCLSFRLPFSMPLAAHTDADSVEATAEVTDVNVRIRRESVFDIKADVAFTLRLSSAHDHRAVESVKLGDAIERPDATVIVHIAKDGETLWQAAKALCCSPESVTRQNEATAPYSGGERLVNFCNK